MKKAVIFASVFVFSLASVSGSLAQEIKVGTLLDHTGPLKEYGPNIQNGVVLAAKQMAAAGFEIKLIHEDSETSAIPATNAAKKLVKIYRVVAIVGSLASGVTVPVAESVTIPNNVIMISPSSTSPLITVLPADQGKDFLFRTCPSDSLQAVIGGKLAASYNKTASVLYVNNPYGQGLAEQFKKSFEKHRGKVLAMVPHDEKAAKSYTAELRKALAENPDILCAFSYPDHAKVYLKEAIEFFKYRRFLFCDGTKSEDIVKALGARNVEGQMGTAPGSPGGDSFMIFNADYKAEFGRHPPLPFITNAYDATAVIGLAAYAAKVKGLPLTAKNIRDNLRNVACPPGEIIKPSQFKRAFDLLKRGRKINYEGAAGSVDFDKNGDVITPIEIWKYSKGKLVTVRVEYEIPSEGTQLTYTPKAQQPVYSRKEKIDKTPPKIIITSDNISRGIKVIKRGKMVTIKGRAIDSSGVAEVVVNNKDAIIDQDGNFLADIYLKVGENNIVVSAMDIYENKATKTFTIIRKGSTIPTIAKLPSRNELIGWYEKQYALVIGIDNYRSSRIDSLQNAVNDAKEASRLFNNMGFEVIELYDMEATKKAILLTFSNILRKIQKNDSFIFYFAGHGQGLLLESKDKVGYIIPYDADISLTDTNVIDYDEEAVGLSDIVKYCKSMKAKHIALLLDSCFSGLALKRSVPKIDDMDFDYYNDLLNRKAINILTAGDDQPVSDGTGHSPFTRAILNGLGKKGLDIHDRDGFATFNQLAVYVKEKVEKATGRRQRPQFDNLSMGDGDFIFNLR